MIFGGEVTQIGKVAGINAKRVGYYLPYHHALARNDSEVVFGVGVPARAVAPHDRMQRMKVPIEQFQQFLSIEIARLVPSRKTRLQFRDRCLQGHPRPDREYGSCSALET